MEPTSTQTPSSPAGTGSLPVIAEYIGVRPGYCGGEPHILGHRVKVRHVAVWHEQEGLSPAEIVATYPPSRCPRCMRPWPITLTTARKFRRHSPKRTSSSAS